jgi:hypothetical protein
MKDMPESIDWNYVFMIRLALAGILGAAIGFERECRAKEAGTRTHFHEHTHEKCAHRHPHTPDIHHNHAH